MRHIAFLPAAALPAVALIAVSLAGCSSGTGEPDGSASAAAPQTSEIPTTEETLGPDGPLPDASGTE